MSILKYEVINPVTDKRKPYVDIHGAFVIPSCAKRYRYYIEVKKYNNTTLDTEYYLLLGTEMFDANCRKCHIDNFGKLRIKINGEFKDFVISEITARGNVNVDYVETDSTVDGIDYDVWQVL